MEAILESVKTPPLTSAEAAGNKMEEDPKIIPVSTSVHAEAGPLELVPEKVAEENLPKKLSVSAPEAFSQGGLDYIICHASGKQLSEE